MGRETGETARCADHHSGHCLVRGDRWRALTVAFGSFLGAPSLRMQLAMSAVLAASGALVLILIIALSNPFRGDFRVSTAPFEHMLSRMEATAAKQ
jgi:hypothetical protein